MDKWLLLDADHSSTSLGSHEAIQKMCGFPPVEINRGLGQLKLIMQELFKARKRKIHNPLFSQVIETEELEYLPRQKVLDLGLTGIFIDTWTHSCHQTREQLRDDMKENKRGNKVLDQGEWGEYGNIVIEHAVLFKNMPMPMVMTCHMDYDTKTPTRPIQVPGVKGGSAHTLTQHFDLALFADVVYDNGRRRMVWRTMPSDICPYAKHRGPSTVDEDGNIIGLLPELCGHNLKEIMEIYRANDMPNIKILIVADSGQGKTHAFKTLFDPEVTLHGEVIRKDSLNAETSAH